MNNLSLFFSCAGFLLSCLSIFYVVVDVWARSWDKVDGELMSFNVAEYKSHLASGEISYRLFINYKYTYKNKIYFSNRLNSSNKVGSTKAGDLEKIVNDISSEDMKYVSVYVCEFSPSYSVLLPGSLNIKLHIFLGIFGAFIGLLMINF